MYDVCQKVFKKIKGTIPIFNKHIILKSELREENMRMSTGNTAQLVSISMYSASSYTCAPYFRNDEKNCKHREKMSCFPRVLFQGKEELRFNLIKEIKERMIADTA